MRYPAKRGEATTAVAGEAEGGVVVVVVGAVVVVVSGAAGASHNGFSMSVDVQPTGAEMGLQRAGVPPGICTW